MSFRELALRSTPSRFALRRLAAFALTATLAAAVPAAAQNNPFNSDGFPAARGTYGSFPYEQIDPLSGNLIIAVTDLSLPGPIPLAVSRSYNSKFHRDFEHGNQSVDEWSPVGVGWRLHFGRVLHATATTSGTTVIEGTDGGGGSLYQTSAYPEGWITKGFVRYNRSTHTALVPNGLVYTFGHVGEASGPRGQVRYVTAIADQYGNSLTFTYGAPGRIAQVHQQLNASRARDVFFLYNGDGTLSKIVYDVREWTFQYDPAPGASGHQVLRRVIPPEGVAWEHVYASNGAGPELVALISPDGGRIDYTYETVQRRSGALAQNSRVARTRTLSGPGVVSGTWTFTYNQGADQDTTVVGCPCGTTTYSYHGIGTSGSGNFSAWASGLLKERKVLGPGGAVVEQETFIYGPSAAVSLDAIPGESGQWSDPDVYNALTTQRTLTRGPYAWTTTYEYNSANYNDFGRPFRVTETGDQTRVSEAVFKYGFAPWIIGGTSSTSVRIAPETIQTSSTNYDLSTGFVTSSTSLGVTTQFAPNANGTVASTTNANGHTTSFSYDWGVLAGTQTPLLPTGRTINPDGTVAAEWTGTDPNPANVPTTRYQYDALGRIRYIRPPNNNFIQHTYLFVNGTSIVQVDRGASQVWTHLDGFGRPTRTYNSLGVKTRTDRDACGRVIYVSAPYTTGDGLLRGTTTTYDELGRVKTVSVTDPSGTPAVTTYNYDGADVSITDALGRTTSHNYNAFGGPADARLMAVTDADGKTTNYQYHTLGSLSRVEGPGSGVPPRIWNYSPAGRLLSETQPESGTTTYTYDTLGNVETITDSMGRITTLDYDANERIISRDAAGTSADSSIGYDQFGRVQTRVIEGVITTFTYDSSSRIATRTDGIHPSMSFTSSYFYDGNDNLIEVRYPCAGVPCTPRSVKYEYDVENRLKKVLNNLAEFAKNFTYDDAGRLVTYETGPVTHRFDYDVRDRVWKLQAGPTSGNALDLTYGYNKVSQVLSIQDPRPGMSQSFTYDNVDRLKTASAPGSYGAISWTYDASGNRLTENRGATTAYNYDPLKNRLTSTTGSNPEVFAYNDVGELKSDGQGNYDYTPAGMLLSATRSGMTANYLYDADHLRVKRTVNNATVLSIRGAGGHVLSEMQSLCGASAQWVRDNIYAGGKLIGAVRNNTLGPATVTFTNASSSPAENAGSGTVTVHLSTPQPLPCPLTVSYETAAGGALPGVAPSGDYTTTAGTLTFAAGSVNNAQMNITVPLSNDSTDENSEELTVRLTGATGGILKPLTPLPAGITSHTVWIQDDDPPPSLTITGLTVSETQATAVLTVTLSAVSGKPVSVAWATSNGSAVAGSDYTQSSGTLTFSPGQASATISVSLIDDVLAELTETFNVTLSSPVNATIASGTAVVTVTSNEVKVPIDPSLPGQYFPDVESSPTEAGYILLFNPHAVPVTVKLTFTRSNGTGLSDTFVLQPGRLTYDLAQHAAYLSGRYSVVVQSTDPARPLVSELSGYSLPSFAAGRNDLGATPAPTWYFGEGVANSFFEETITVFNPTDGPVQVHINFIKPGAPPALLTPLIPHGPGRVELRVNDWLGIVGSGDHGLIVSGFVQGTSTPANVVVHRTLRWPVGTAIESSTTSGTSATAANWYFAEGGKGAWSNYLAFMNPSSVTANAFVFYVHDNGQTYGQQVPIPSMRRVTMSPPPGMPDGGFAIHVGSSDAVHYVVERSLYTGTNFAVGGASTATATPSVTWRFAEGASDGMFDTYFLVFNSNPTYSANVLMTFRKANGTVATHSFTLAPRTRGVVSVDALPAVNGTSYATEVTTTNAVPIVVERSMFWPQGAWNGSYLSLGRPQ